MSPWLSDSEICLFCKDPLISSLGGHCLADSWNTLDDQEPAGGVVCHTTIFLKAVLTFWSISGSRSDMMNVFPFRNVQTGYKVWVSRGHLRFSDWACLRDVACGEFTRVREERTKTLPVTSWHHRAAITSQREQRILAYSQKSQLSEKSNTYRSFQYVLKNEVSCKWRP